MQQITKEFFFFIFALCVFTYFVVYCYYVVRNLNMSLAPNTVSDFKRANLIFGPRCSGKTALLYDLLLKESESHKCEIFLFSHEIEDLRRSNRITVVPYSDEMLESIHDRQVDRIKKEEKKCDKTKERWWRQIESECRIVLAFDECMNLDQTLPPIMRQVLMNTLHLCASIYITSRYCRLPPFMRWKSCAVFCFSLNMLNTSAFTAHVYNNSNCLRTCTAHGPHWTDWDSSYKASQWNRFESMLRLDWREANAILCDVSIALSAFDLPVYVLLTIVDFLPDFYIFTQWRKVTSLEKIRDSTQRITEFLDRAK